MLHFYRRYNKTKDCFTIWRRNINLVRTMRLSAVVKVFLMVEVRQWQLRSRVSYIYLRQVSRYSTTMWYKNDDKTTTEGRSSNVQTPKERIQNSSEIKRFSVIRGLPIIQIGFCWKLIKHEQYALIVTLRVTNLFTTIWLLILSHQKTVVILCIIVLHKPTKITLPFHLFLQHVTNLRSLWRTLTKHLHELLRFYITENIHG